MAVQGLITETIAARRFRPAGTARVPLAASILLLVVQAIGIAVGRLVLAHGDVPHSGGIAGQLLSWDGRWYYKIARVGYEFSKPVILRHYQDIAFFPAQPLLDRLVMTVTGSPAPVLIVLISMGFGIASIFAFDTLARTVLRPEAARWATVFYAIWPASGFYLMGYPTGLIGLCAILALKEYVAGRFWRSAVWCGIGTLAAPTMVFVVAALGIHRAILWLKGGARPKQVIPLALWGGLAVAGLLGFMLYQVIAFHDPFAFTEAQIAWGVAPPGMNRLARLTEWRWYIQQPRAGISEIASGLAMLRHGVPLGHAMVPIQAGIQRWINASMFAVSLVGLVTATVVLRGRARLIAAASWIVLFGYLWFIFSTNQNMLGVPRLLFPAIAIFPGLGWLAARWYRGFGWGLLVLFGLLSLAEAAFVAGGYWVV